MEDIEMQFKNKSTIVYNDMNKNSNTVVLESENVSPSITKSGSIDGDIITYNILIKNRNDTPITNLPFIDLFNDLNASNLTSYVPNSFKVNSVAETPVITDDGLVTASLTYTIPTILGDDTANVEFKVSII